MSTRLRLGAEGIGSLLSLRVDRRYIAYFKAVGPLTRLQLYPHDTCFVDDTSTPPPLNQSMKHTAL